MTEGGYSDVAKALTDRFGLQPPVDRRQVEIWSKRGTRNKAGRHFPDPVHEDRNAKPRQPRLLFSIEQVIEWYAAGVPDLYGKGWKE